MFQLFGIIFFYTQYAVKKSLHCGAYVFVWRMFRLLFCFSKTTLATGSTAKHELWKKTFAAANCTGQLLTYSATHEDGRTSICMPTALQDFSKTLFLCLVLKIEIIRRDIKNVFLYYAQNLLHLHFKRLHYALNKTEIETVRNSFF